MRIFSLLVMAALMAACSQPQLITQAPPTLGPVSPYGGLDCDPRSEVATLITGSLCDPMNWLTAQYQLQALSPDERRALLLTEPLDGDYGLMVMALLHSQPDSPTTLRSLSQDALQALLPRAPHDLYLHLHQLSRYNGALLEQEHRLAEQHRALMVRGDAHNAQQRIIETLQQALAATREQLAEKQAQVEALTDIESNLGGDRDNDRTLPQPLELRLNDDDE
ncbi:hypothetical protein E4656_19065 [Natronospirillum operosum]|uniref:Uncharacterized protein n=1 Tax=Natronospirillum operosum TaxID=2759953 RepID=A0A4Z0W4H2_9GAMM|nr:hypothetical protein [Natronospirillum operosum]TGG90228.1 hypothetical protein E4656_19065 [Natronospirillum operosum]